MFLANQVQAATIEEDVVLLDLRGGSYFCLPQALGAFQSLAEGRLDDEALCEALAEHDLVQPRPRAARAAPPPLAAREIESGLSLAGPREWIAGLASYGEMIGGYYGRSFGAILGRAEARALARPASEASLRRQVKAFRTLLPWAPFPGVCLFRSRLLLEFLRRSGHQATWVFGVRTWPFEAHCWLQFGDLVLDDTLDSVRTYAPIHWVGA